MNELEELEKAELDLKLRQVIRRGILRVGICVVVFAVLLVLLYFLDKLP